MRKVQEDKAKKLLVKWGIPVVRERVSKDKKAAFSFAKEIGYPVVIKIASPDIIHKTECGCVITNIKDQKELDSSYDTVMCNARKFSKNARINGVLIQEMVDANDARELIIGAKIDPNFGPIVMFGIGGIMVEILKDVSFRVIPIAKKDAYDMLSEIRAHKILDSVRGKKPVNKEKLVQCLINVSMMMEKEKDIIELDLNPIFADHKGVKAVDIRIIKK
jgi:acyl-CoA synthetase (NDP forming)